MANEFAGLRTKRGLTQEQAAEVLGVTREHLSRVENGQRSVTWNVLVPMAELYRVSLARLARIARANKLMNTSRRRSAA